MNSRRLIEPSRVARTASQPTDLDFISILEGRNPLGVGERERNIVRAGQKALLPERVDFESFDRAVGPGQRLRSEIDDHMTPGRLLQHGSQRGDPLGGQYHRQQAILKAVVEKYVPETRRQHGPDAVIVKRPYRCLARRSAAEIAIRDHDAGIPICVQVEHELWLRRAGVTESQVMEQQVPPAVTAFAPQEARRSDLVGVDVRHPDRYGDGVKAGEGFHHGLRSWRTSVSLPATAAAAAMAGLMRWVRAPLP